MQLAATRGSTNRTAVNVSPAAPVKRTLYSLSRAPVKMGVLRGMRDCEQGCSASEVNRSYPPKRAFAYFSHEGKVGRLPAKQKTAQRSVIPRPARRQNLPLMSPAQQNDKTKRLLHLFGTRGDISPRFHSRFSLEGRDVAGRRASASPSLPLAFHMRLFRKLLSAGGSFSLAASLPCYWWRSSRYSTIFSILPRQKICVNPGGGTL